MSGAPATPQVVHDVTIRLAGDSGDGMQLTGDRFTALAALAGNDLATLPDFPAEIRAPAGTLPGVSAFQVRIADREVTTPGDDATVMVAMNPAALRSELSRVAKGGTIILNSDGFDERSQAKAGYETDPRTSGELDAYEVVEVPMTRLTKEAVAGTGVSGRHAGRSKNFFALGILSWMYSRDPESVGGWIDGKFSKDDAVRQANRKALAAGHAFGETAELGANQVVVPAATRAPGTYRSVDGNTALAWGLIAAGVCAELPLFLGSYPITPASAILHELARHPDAGVRTFQAEDEIAAITAAIGASFGGHLAITTTSGPGLSLKAEALGLAISLELPLVVVNIQRGGPATGLPTKTEASDLLQAMYGRHGESPVPVIAASRPGECFDAAIEAARVALKYRTPVILLSDGYLANSAEPWRIPDAADLPDISVAKTTEPNHVRPDGTADFWPYERDPETLARPWAVPGTPGLEHRIGGIEKADGTGNISYDADNHQRMTDLRAAKVAGIAKDIPPVEIGGDVDADTLIVGWGSTWGAIEHSMARLTNAGHQVAHVHLRHLNPFPPNLGEVLARYDHVVVPELNSGQLCRLLRAEFLVDAHSISKVAGQPFSAAELTARISEVLR
ncbi:MAG: 2-oxoacid:acceptor oxidoreductase subunit alpha [Microthrixaceae bacterium]